jgi:hypothetical protein
MPCCQEWGRNLQRDSTNRAAFPPSVEAAWDRELARPGERIPASTVLPGCERCTLEDEPLHGAPTLELDATGMRCDIQRSDLGCALLDEAERMTGYIHSHPSSAAPCKDSGSRHHSAAGPDAHAGSSISGIFVYFSAGRM